MGVENINNEFIDINNNKYYNMSNFYLDKYNDIIERFDYYENNNIEHILNIRDILKGNNMLFDYETLEIINGFCITKTDDNNTTNSTLLAKIENRRTNNTPVILLKITFDYHYIDQYSNIDIEPLCVIENEFCTYIDRLIDNHKIKYSSLLKYILLDIEISKFINIDNKKLYTKMEYIIYPLDKIIFNENKLPVNITLENVLTIPQPDNSLIVIGKQILEYKYLDDLEGDILTETIYKKSIFKILNDDIEGKEDFIFTNYYSPNDINYNIDGRIYFYISAFTNYGETIQYQYIISNNDLFDDIVYNSNYIDDNYLFYNTSALNDDTDYYIKLQAKSSNGKVWNSPTITIHNF